MENLLKETEEDEAVRLFDRGINEDVTIATKLEAKLLGSGEGGAGKLDLYKSFESTLPFTKMQLSKFITYVQKAELKCGSKGFVTKEDLQETVLEL